MTGNGSQSIEIVIRLQLELPPGMTLTAAAPTHEALAYRIPEAAVKLGIGKSKVAELVARGEIASVKVDNGSRLILADSLRAYLASLSAADQESA